MYVLYDWPEHVFQFQTASSHRRVALSCVYLYVNIFHTITEYSLIRPLKSSREIWKIKPFNSKRLERFIKMKKKILTITSHGNNLDRCPDYPIQV